MHGSIVTGQVWLTTGAIMAWCLTHAGWVSIWNTVDCCTYTLQVCRMKQPLAARAACILPLCLPVLLSTLLAPLFVLSTLLLLLQTMIVVMHLGRLNIDSSWISIAAALQASQGQTACCRLGGLTIS